MNWRHILRFAPLAIALSTLAVGLTAGEGAGATQHHKVALDPSKVEIQSTGSGGEAVVRYPGAAAPPVGSPDVPRVPVWIEVPAGMQAAAVRATPSGLRDLGQVRVASAVDWRSDGLEAKPPIGMPATPAGEWALLGRQGSLRGHWVVCVLVAPATWDEATGRLTGASAVDVELELEPLAAERAAAVVPRARIVREIETRFDESIGKTITGYIPARPTEELVGDGPAGPGPYQPTFRPTTDGSAVEYVIVTSQALATEFERLADWKTQKGVQATVRTVEWIDQTYPNGVDRAERIRFFVRDAYQNWGTAFVLLGGDSDVIPVRYGVTTYFNGEQIPADMYFGCLDGNWNADGDGQFGEAEIGLPSDDADLEAEVSVGRAPVSTVGQADTFVDKMLLYEISPPMQARYPASILVMAERLFPPSGTHGGTIAETALAFVPNWMRIVRLYEEAHLFQGAIELTRQAALDSINAGFGIVHHVGHGYRNTMSIGPGTINNADSDALINSPRNSVVFAINCSSASIDFNSIGERWVKNPNGGSIAYIGTSRLAFVSPSAMMQNAWYEAVFDSTTRSLGPAVDIARMSIAGTSDFDGPNRWNVMATTLLGDPEVDLYTNAVIPMQVAHAGSVALGSAPITFTVTAQGTPVPGATVTLWKADQVYVRGTTNGAGVVQLANTATTTGPVIVTAHKSYYRPYVSAVNVTSATTAYLHVNAITVDDDALGFSNGDGDGFADAGETIELRVTLRNAGNVSATSVQATLTENDPEDAIVINPTPVTYGTINPGGQSQGSGAFLITIDPSAPVAYQPVLTANITATQGTWQDLIVLPIRRPYLEHYSHFVDDLAPRGDGDGVVEADETIYYRITLKNTGQDRATAVTGTLAALQKSNQQPHPLVTVADASSSWGTINPDFSVQGDRFEFTLAANCDPKTVLLRVTLNDDLGPVDVELLDVEHPTPPDSITAFGAPSSIRLTWKKPISEDVKGYDVLRSLNAAGPFNRINEFTIDGSASYEDPNLLPLTRYYYKIVARDSSYNASDETAAISGSTNPPIAAGWPIEMGQQSAASAIVADIDGGSQSEILTGGEMVYAWHADGTEVVDGDQDARTNGPFSLLGRSTITAGFNATPAAGDVNEDGVNFEVMNVGFTADSVTVWTNAGLPMPSWPKSVYDQSTWASPIMADLDLDGDHEIIVWAGQGGRLLAWHHNGVELADGDNNPSTNGVLARITGTSFNYGSPAVANLDLDPQLEILFPVNLSTDHSGGIYAVNMNGSGVLGWPFFSGSMAIPSEVSSSLAVGDLDRNGTDEVVFSCEREGGRVYVLNRDGSVRSGWPKVVAAYTPGSRLTSPSLADLDNDGFLDVVFPSTNGILYAWNRNGVLLPGFPQTYYPNPQTQTSECTASIGDIDGNGDLEILFGDEKGKVHGYNHNGTLANGFPIQLAGEVRATPAIWDTDHDGLVEIVVVCFDAHTYVFDLPGVFNPLRMPWPFIRHDARNTGRFSTPVQQIGVEEPALAPIVAVPAFHPVHPNPFNPMATLAFDVPGMTGDALPVTLDIYDVSGRLVRRLVDGAIDSGRHEVLWDGRGQDGGAKSSGVYFARIAIADFVATQKLTMLR